MLSVVAIVELAVNDPFHLIFEDLGVVVGIRTILIFGSVSSLIAVWTCSQVSALNFNVAASIVSVNCF